MTNEKVQTSTTTGPPKATIVSAVGRHQVLQCAHQPLLNHRCSPPHPPPLLLHAQNQHSSGPLHLPKYAKACTSLNLLSHGLCFHQHAAVNGYSSDAYISASLINFYAKFGYPDVARKVFDVMPERNVVPWTAIIGCYARLGEVNTAFQKYSQMQYEGFKPSSVTILAMLSGVSEIHIQSFHACAIQFGFCYDLALANCMLNSYGKHGRVGDARSLFESMDKRDVVSWNSLISAYAMVDNVREISQLLFRMSFSGFDPDHQTFGSLISAATRNGNPIIGKLGHAKIVTNGFEVDLQVKTLLITMYLKFNDLTNAFRIFEATLEKNMIL